MTRTGGLVKIHARDGLWRLGPDLEQTGHFLASEGCEESLCYSLDGRIQGRICHRNRGWSLKCYAYHLGRLCHEKVMQPSSDRVTCPSVNTQDETTFSMQLACLSESRAYSHGRKASRMLTIACQLGMLFSEVLPWEATRSLGVGLYRHATAVTRRPLVAEALK